MNLNVPIDDEVKTKLDDLKKARFTQNASQIVREALHYYWAFLFAKNGTYNSQTEVMEITEVKNE